MCRPCATCPSRSRGRAACALPNLDDFGRSCSYCDQVWPDVAPLWPNIGQTWPDSADNRHMSSKSGPKWPMFAGLGSSLPNSERRFTGFGQQLADLAKNWVWIGSLDVNGSRAAHGRPDRNDWESGTSMTLRARSSKSELCPPKMLFPKGAKKYSRYKELKRAAPPPARSPKNALPIALAEAPLRDDDLRRHGARWAAGRCGHPRRRRAVVHA